MDNLIKQADLEVYFNSEEFVLKTQEQIAKDFSVVHIDFPEDFKDVTYSKDKILLLLEDKINSLLQRSDTKLGQLLYAVDISEQQFIRLTSSNTFVPQLAEFVLRREAFKVYLRHKFSG